MTRSLCLSALLASLLLVSPASAHYLWIVIDSGSGDHGTAHLYFEEAARPGDGFYLDPFVKNGKTWIRTIDKINPQSVKMTEVKKEKLRFLTAKLSASAPRGLESYGKFGVYRYGQTDVLLHYYARVLEVDTHEDLHELSKAKHMDLDIVPHDNNDEMRLTVTWKGKTAENRTVYVRGPKGFRVNLKTDEFGSVRFKMKGKGQYSFRTSFQINQGGKEGDKEYSQIRHHATLSMKLPLSE